MSSPSLPDTTAPETTVSGAVEHFRPAITARVAEIDAAEEPTEGGA